MQFFGSYLARLLEPASPCPPKLSSLPFPLRPPYPWPPGEGKSSPLHPQDYLENPTVTASTLGRGYMLACPPRSARLLTSLGPCGRSGPLRSVPCLTRKSLRNTCEMFLSCTCAARTNYLPSPISFDHGPAFLLIYLASQRIHEIHVHGTIIFR